MARPPLAERLAQSADGVLEQIARDYAVSTFDVVRALPAEHRAILPGSKFEEILQALTEWGEVLFIVHTPDIVLECAGTMPPGSFAPRLLQSARRQPDRRPHQGRELRAHRLRQPARSWAGRRARCSSSTAGEAMFKVFVRRDKERNLLADQVAALRRAAPTHGGRAVAPAACRALREFMTKKQRRSAAGLC